LIKPFVSITILPLLPLKIIKTEHILIYSKNPKTKTLKQKPYLNLTSQNKKTLNKNHQ
jgi:hypothetical protein